MNDHPNKIDVRNWPPTTEVRFTRGTRIVITSRQNGVFSSRLYVNRGETATTTSAEHKTLTGAEKWARKVLPR